MPLAFRFIAQINAKLDKTWKIYCWINSPTSCADVTKPPTEHFSWHFRKDSFVTTSFDWNWSVWGVTVRNPYFLQFPLCPCLYRFRHVSKRFYEHRRGWLTTNFELNSLCETRSKGCETREFLGSLKSASWAIRVWLKRWDESES